MPNLITATAKQLLGLIASNDDAQVMHFAAPIELTAAPSGGKRPTFKIMAYSGGPLSVSMSAYPVVIELTGLKAARSKLPILMNHDMDRPVGQADRVEITAAGVTLTGSITGDDEDAQRITSHAKNGFDWQASIGASVERREFVESGREVTVNGQKFTGPIVIARASTLVETSFVTIGADQTTQVDLAAKQGSSYMSLPNTTTDNTTGSDLDTIRAQRAAEHERIAKVELAAQGHPAIAAKAIGEGWSVDKTELEVIRAGRSSVPRVSAANGPTEAATLEAALCLSFGLGEKFVAEQLPEGQREQVMNAALSRPYRGISIQAICRAVLAAAGESAGPGFSDSTIRATFEADRMLRASGGFSTISLPGILSNTASKIMLNSYQAVAVTWNQFCRVGSTSNFKAAKRYRLVGMGEFKVVPDDGELKHVSLAEQEYDAQVDTRGAIMTLTRKMIINDDLGAFLALPAVLGRMAAISVDEAAYTLLMSNPSNFFSTGNKNYFYGASSALGIDSLSTAEQKFNDQVDENGKPILVNPDVLIVPTALKTTGRSIVDSQDLQRDQAEDRQPTANPFTKRLDLVVSPWLSNAAITGNSSTAWYLTSGPSDVAALEVSFLNGQQTPTIESGETSFETLGMSMRAFNDFGVSMGDHRAAVKSKGAA